jgi:NADH:ubiquinone oxidoreductase subunit 6 (subunit J)
LNPLVLLAEETANVATVGVAERIVRLPLAWAIVLAAISIFLLLPRGGKRLRWLGTLLGLVSIGLFGWYGLSLGGWVPDLVFYVLAGVTVIAAAATITSRSPVYSAVWFALVLLGTAGLFLYQGAQFLGVATVVVYAGAILVTFLFVLMLAQPGGDAYYDRMSWEPLLSAVAGAVLVGLLTGAVLQATGTAVLAQVPTEELKSDDESAEASDKSSESKPATTETQATPEKTPSATEKPAEEAAPETEKPAPAESPRPSEKTPPGTEEPADEGTPKTEKPVEESVPEAEEPAEKETPAEASATSSDESPEAKESAAAEESLKTEGGPKVKEPIEEGAPPEPEMPVEEESPVETSPATPEDKTAAEPETAELADQSDVIPPGADQIALRAPGGVLTNDHVATLGQEMFSRRLIAVQVAGALLLAALVGAVAIVTQGKQLPQVDPHAQEHGSSPRV